jgi:hypothetical protein
MKSCGRAARPAFQWWVSLDTFEAWVSEQVEREE